MYVYVCLYVCIYMRACMHCICEWYVFTSVWRYLSLCAYWDQRSMSSVLLCYSLPYFPEAESLSEPASRLEPLSPSDHPIVIFPHSWGSCRCLQPCLSFCVLSAGNLNSGPQRVPLPRFFVPKPQLKWLVEGLKGYHPWKRILSCVFSSTYGAKIIDHGKVSSLTWLLMNVYVVCLQRRAEHGSFHRLLHETKDTL